MLQLFLIKNFLAFVLFMLSIVLGVMGRYGVIRSKFLHSKTAGELIIVIIMVSFILMVSVNILYLIINYFLCINNLNTYTSCVIDNNSNAQDPVRFWPSGTAQTWGILGAAATIYRSFPGSRQAKIWLALSSLSVTIPLNVYFHAVENPNGFNRLMYSWVEHRRTGIWPANIPADVGENSIDTAITQSSREAQNAVNSAVNSNTFSVSDYSHILSKPEDILGYILGFFKPVAVEGHLDDLVGQQLFIHFLLISVVIGLIIMFSFYLVLHIVYYNKDYILKRFDNSNRYIKLYLRYQVILSKISLIIIPMFILLGLIELFVGLHFLITHPIPYEELPIDLHTYIKTPK